MRLILITGLTAVITLQAEQACAKTIDERLRSTTLDGLRISVSLCNKGNLPLSVVARAKREAEAVFHTAQVDINWEGCIDRSAAPDAGMRWFMLRLRSDAPHKSTGDSSVKSMGSAFLTESGEGWLADAYFPAIRDRAIQYQADAAALLGQVMAHELGHLLLGPGHEKGSIMRDRWVGNGQSRLRQDWQRFTPTEQERIRRKTAQ